MIVDGARQIPNLQMYNGMTKRGIDLISRSQRCVDKAKKLLLEYKDML